jgi:ClpP class serine protease
MNATDLFWLFFLFMSLQPVLQRRWLEASRQRMIYQLEHERGSRVILLVHRQETMGLLGFPIFRFIDVNDSEEVLRAIQMTDPEVPIDLVLHTPGGLVLAALQIARAIAHHRGEVTVFVPHYAMSGGTLIALTADHIVMSEHAVLGPVDPQLGRYPAASVLRVVKQKSVDEIHDKTLILADQAEKAVRQVREAVRELLGEGIQPEKADEISRLLSEGTWTHDYPITADAARSLGLPVRTDIPEAVLRLMTLYPQPVRQQSTVEYLNVPRRKGGRSA